VAVVEGALDRRTREGLNVVPMRGSNQMDENRGRMEKIQCNSLLFGLSEEVPLAKADQAGCRIRIKTTARGQIKEGTVRRHNNETTLQKRCCPASGALIGRDRGKAFRRWGGGWSSVNLTTMEISVNRRGGRLRGGRPQRGRSKNTF